MGNCCKGSKKTDTTPTNGIQHAGNKPGSTQATEPTVREMSKPAPQYGRIEQPHPAVHDNQPQTPQQSAVSHANSALSSQASKRLPLTNPGARQSATFNAEPVPQARRPTETNDGKTVPSTQGKPEQSLLKPEASILAPSNGKPTQTGAHSIPATSSQEYKQPGTPFDASRTAPANGKPTQTGTHAILAPPSQEYKQPGTPFDASRTAPAHGKPTQTGTHAIPAPPSQEYKQPGTPFDASRTAPANGKPTQTGTHAIPAPPSQEYKQPGTPFDSSRTAPANGKPTQTGTHAIPAPPSREYKQPRTPFDSSRTAPANGKPTQTGTHAIPAPPSQEYYASQSAPAHGKHAQTVEPYALQEELVLNENPITMILGGPIKNIKLHYRLGRELGRGRSSIVYHCTEIFTGKTYACKSISKDPANISGEYVRREVKILERLRQKPNIVEFKEAFEDSHSVHLVMELCTGGELLDKIIEKRNYSEREAASVFRSIANIIYTCHTKGVMHRDIKPENFLQSTELENSALKAIDFGSSVSIEEGMEYRDIVGTPYYVAPEVLRRCYNKEADIWSAGVILYILLCGVPPFRGETETDIYNAILSKELDLVSPPWSSISSSAKDLVKKILNKDPTGRISLLGILGHPWVQEGGEASDKPLDGTILRIKQTREQPGRYRLN